MKNQRREKKINKKKQKTTTTTTTTGPLLLRLLPRGPLRGRRPLLLPAARHGPRLLPPDGRGKPRHQAREHAARRLQAAAARQAVRLWVLEAHRRLEAEDKGRDARVHRARGGEGCGFEHLRRACGGRVVCGGKEEEFVFCFFFFIFCLRRAGRRRGWWQRK